MPKSIVIMENMSIHHTMTKQFIDTNIYCILYNAILYYIYKNNISNVSKHSLQLLSEECLRIVLFFLSAFSTFFSSVYFVY